MSTYFRQLLLGALLALAAASASATSPCREPEGCLDEWPVFVLTLMEAQLTYCPAFASFSDAQKEELLQENFKGEGTPGYLDRLRATVHYANRAEMIAQIQARPSAIEDLCKELLVKKK
ncbi:hypothetical protein [Massilia genomosp. 1]|uniref:Secreted protein n=1 Tax=Massilia genomosp. 1 TaxID=2609280 RepID=A0ABX0MUM5_9BURK|nr:hypothetical protein [Massilia genomosp. 1]NHZ65742.1 hypothetical protein [Massilia genomosp. 1]